jgi:hypothetical protein
LSPIWCLVLTISLDAKVRYALVGVLLL